MTNRRSVARACASVFLFLLLASAGLDGRRPYSGDRLDDAAFWRLFSECSEPSGYFQSDNLLSNERGFPAVLPEIARRASSNGAYIGVGPEQNFSYLAVLRPRIAFIIDVRRQNAVLHLMYKSLFELAPNRAEFVSRLFSRPTPRGLSAASNARDLFEAFSRVPAKADLFASNLAAVKSHLLKRHHFALTAEDLNGLKVVYSAFFEAGPALTYSMSGGRGGRGFPTYADLMLAADDAGVARSYLATETSYQVLRDLQRRNLIIPVVGDFSGPKAFKAVGAQVSRRGLTVRALYASNVESYLFRNDVWRGFYENLAALPTDRLSVVVRSLSRGFGGRGLGFPGGGGYPGPGGFPGGGMGRLVLDPIDDLLSAVRRGEVATYSDVLARPGVRIE
jgi:hypothetical protein